jgi:hypothetical protein
MTDKQIAQKRADRKRRIIRTSERQQDRTAKVVA